MYEQLNTGLCGNQNAGITLRNLVNQLVSDSLATAIQHKTVIINEVPASLRIAAKVITLGPVIAELLATVVANSKKGQIHISAERFRDLIIFQVQDRNNYNGYALAYSLKSIEPMAALVGGCISIRGQQELETTISFSFPTHPGTPVYEC